MTEFNDNFGDFEVIIVTSPHRSHPDTSMIDKVIDSLNLIENMKNYTLHVVYDSYNLINEKQKQNTKSGRISKDLADKYENFKLNMKEKYQNNNNNNNNNNMIRYNHIILKDHNGYAMGVKIGLENCISEYCLVLQHDRAFINIVNCINDLKKIFLNNNSIRYIHFPTTASLYHDRLLKYNYTKVSEIYNTKRIQFIEETTGKSSLLQPMIFLYDSNFICSKSKFLEIYRPWRNMNAEMREWIGLKSIKDMLLRKGDFIEDRLGQQQRKILVGDGFDLDIEKRSQIFDWFGMYVAYIDFQPDLIEQVRYDKKKETVLVGHLRTLFNK